MDTRELAEKLRLGSCPIMPSRDAMEAGDEILALLDGRVIGLETINRSVGDQLRDVLVGFGAIDAMDFTTNPLDILPHLLPPQHPEPSA